MRLHGSQEALAALEDAHENEIPIEGKVVGVLEGPEATYERVGMLMGGAA